MLEIYSHVSPPSIDFLFLCLLPELHDSLSSLSPSQGRPLHHGPQAGDVAEARRPLAGDLDGELERRRHRGAHQAGDLPAAPVPDQEDERKVINNKTSAQSFNWP